VIEQSPALSAEQWRGRGLALQPRNTRLTHTLPPDAGGAGFDVRGFSIRPSPTKATRGYTPSSTPSRRAVAPHKRQIAEVLRRQRLDRPERLLDALNPVIRGGSTYVSTGWSRATGEAVAAALRHHRRWWRRFRPPHTPRQGAYQPYGWQMRARSPFAPPGGGTRLAFPAERARRRHGQGQARRSPEAGDEVDGSTRRGHYPGVSTRVSTLLKRQAGTCRHCGDACQRGDVREVDPLLPRAAGGRAVYTTWPLWHR
jgi:RNA-directed DNA polymerase